ncbi:MAG TPA: hypothetical protein VGE69_09465 [Pseudomonadales bacterium]
MQQNELHSHPEPPLRRNFTSLIAALSAVMLLLLVLSLALASTANAAEAEPLDMPVSINALMVTFIDHAAHHIWDYGSMERDIRDDEWRIIEYYAIQLAAAGPAITLGGTGEFDMAWMDSPAWTEHARNMSTIAQQAIVAAQDQDKTMLRAVGNDLTDSCEGCHALFKPDLPTEGIDHNPDYDLLYHIFGNWRTTQ